MNEFDRYDYSDPLEAALEEPAREAERPGGGPKRWMFLLALGVAAVPLAWAEFPREVARWHVAAALEKHEAGDLIGALKSLEEARDWDAKSELVFEKEALHEYDLAIQMQPQQPQYYLARSSVLHFLGRYPEATRDCATAVELITQGYTAQMSESLNGLAYARALSNQDLDEGLREVEQALRLAGDRAHILDTRGYLHFLLGNYDQARSDLDAAVEKTEKSLQELSSANLSGARQLRRNQLRSSLAAILYHRLQLFEKLDEADLAEKDRQRIRQLGIEPSEKLH